MKRQEAVRVIKELCASCNTLYPKAIDLKQSDFGAGHYEIRVIGVFDNKIWHSLKSIAKKYSLEIKLTDQTLIIYRQEDKRNDKIVHF
jgi:hypothetical protein